MARGIKQHTNSFSSLGQPSSADRQRIVYSSSTGKLKFSVSDDVDGGSAYRVDSCIECWGCRNQDMRPWVLRSIFLLVVGVALVFSGLILKFSVFGKEDLVLTEGDMIMSPVSTYFCAGVKYVLPRSAKLRVYILPKEPGIATTRRTYSVRKRFSLPSWSYQYWGFTLLKGSVVNIMICSDQYINFSVLKGQQSLEDWTQSILYRGYFLTAGIPPSKSCDTAQGYHSLSFEASENDLYYILFSSSSGFTYMTAIYTDLRMNRTVFDLTDRLQSYDCNQTTYCTTRLRYRSKDIGVVEVVASHGSHPDPFKTVKLSINPQARAWFYCVLLCGVFGAIFVLTVLYSIWRTCARGKGHEKEAEPLLSSRYHIKNLRRKVPPRKRKPSPWIVCIPEENEKDIDIEQKDCNASIDSQKGFDTYSSYSLLLASYEADDTEVMPGIRYARQQSTHGDLPEVDVSHYQSQQQLVDSCMTSASVSAI